MMRICPPFGCTATNAGKRFCNHDPVGLQPPFKGLLPPCELEDNRFPTRRSATLLSFTSSKREKKKSEQVKILEVLGGILP